MNKHDKLWNFLMEVLGTPLTVFIFLSWYTNSGKTNLFAIAALFIVAVVITASNPRVAGLEALLGTLILIGTRQLLMIPIKLWFEEPFCWFNQQTACAGVLSFFIVRLFLAYYNSMTEKK